MEIKSIRKINTADLDTLSDDYIAKAITPHGMFRRSGQSGLVRRFDGRTKGRSAGMAKGMVRRARNGSHPEET